MNQFLYSMLQKFGRGKDFTPHCVGWNLSPKINAVFRSDDFDLRKRLFYALVEEYDLDDVIKDISKCHRIQSETSKRLYSNVVQNLIINNKSIVGFIPTEFKAYTGLVASRLCGEFHKPAFVLRELDAKLLSGSYRSPVNIGTIINKCGLATSNGHEKSAGVIIKKSNLKKFLKWFDLQDVGIQDEIQVAAEIAPEQITLPLCSEIAKYEYLYANDLPAPQFYTKFTVPSDCNPFVGTRGTTFKYGALLKFSCKQEDIELLKHGADVEAIVELGVNEYNGTKYPQAKIVQWEIKPLEDKSIAQELNWDEIFN